MRSDRGSTIPLILGFFLIAMFVVAGSIALGQAFVQQRDLQDVCDGAAAAAAATSADLDRSHGIAATDDSLRFADAQHNVDAYLARDPSRDGVQAVVTLSADARRVRLACSQTRHLVFGALFGRADVAHHAVSTARAAIVAG